MYLFLLFSAYTDEDLKWKIPKTLPFSIDRKILTLKTSDSDDSIQNKLC